jgi:hypothetical protein
MSNFAPFGANQSPTVPTPPRGEVIARYGSYLEAQRAVDFLSDSHFPVQHVTIVGTDLRMVERVTGRLSYGRVAFAGALSGAWFGLFVGLLLELFSNSRSVSVFAAVLIGAGFGVLFGVMSFAFTGGRRDFTSTSQIVANEYQVLCLEEHANAARQLLDRLPRGVGRGSGPTAPATVLPPPHPPVGQPPVSSPPLGQPPAGSPPLGQPPLGSTPADVPGPDLPPSGPTYGEMIDRQRAAERAEAERAEAERAEAERAATERAAAERRAREHAAGEPGQAESGQAGG